MASRVCSEMAGVHPEDLGSLQKVVWRVERVTFCAVILGSCVQAEECDHLFASSLALLLLTGPTRNVDFNCCTVSLSYPLIWLCCPVLLCYWHGQVTEKWIDIQEFIKYSGLNINVLWETENPHELLCKAYSLLSHAECHETKIASDLDEFKENNKHQ